MAANKKAVQVRISTESASRAGHQRAHDLRIGPQPNYVDPARSHLNRVLIEPWTSAQLRSDCEDARAKRGVKRAMKSNAGICVSGIITFGHEAQKIFETLTPEQQDAAYQDVAVAIANRLSTLVTGLVVHGDESAPHAHFQMPGYTHDGLPISQIAKRGALRDIQTIAAEVMARHAPGIERGKDRWQRLREGEDYADTVNRAVILLHDELPAEIDAKGDELGKVLAKLDTNRKRLAKAEADLARAIETTGEESAKAEKLRKRAATYEARAAKAEAEAERLTAELDAARAALDKINAAKTAAAAELDELTKAAAQKKTKIGSLKARLRDLNAA